MFRQDAPPLLPTLSGQNNKKGDADSADETDAPDRSEGQLHSQHNEPGRCFDNGTPIGSFIQGAVLVAAPDGGVASLGES